MSNVCISVGFILYNSKHINPPPDTYYCRGTFGEITYRLDAHEIFNYKKNVRIINLKLYLQFYFHLTVTNLNEDNIFGCTTRHFIQ